MRRAPQLHGAAPQASIQGSPRSQHCCTPAQGMLQQGEVGIPPMESPHMHPTSRPHCSLPGPISVGQPHRGAQPHPCTARLGAQSLPQQWGAAGTPRAAPALQKSRQGKEAQGGSPKSKGGWQKEPGAARPPHNPPACCCSPSLPPACAGS